MALLTFKCVFAKVEEHNPYISSIVFIHNASWKKVPTLQSMALWRFLVIQVIVMLKGSVRTAVEAFQMRDDASSRLQKQI